MKFGTDPCRLGHGSFHKNLMHTVKKLVLSPGLEGTMSFLPFILSQQLDEILQVFFTKTWGNYAVLATDSVRINMMERELLVIGSFTDLWSPSRQFLNADSVTLRLVITNHGVIISSSQQSQFPFNLLWVDLDDSCQRLFLQKGLDFSDWFLKGISRNRGPVSQWVSTRYERQTM